MKIRNKLVLVFALLGMLWTAAPVLAQGPLPTPSDDEVNAIAKNLYCPVCENIPLDMCPTQACAEWREEIRDLLVQGLTEEEIYDYFVERYGDRVLAEPPRRGLNWLVYILPPIVFLVGAYILYRGFRSWRKPVEELAGEAPLPSGEEKDEYVSRLEEELKRRQ